MGYPAMEEVAVAHALSFELFAEELPLDLAEAASMVMARSGNTWGSAGCFCTFSCIGGCAGTASSASTASCFPSP